MAHYVCLLEPVPRHAMTLDEVPVVLDTESRPIRNRKAAVTADCIELIAVPIRLAGRHRIGTFRPHQSQAAIIGVADCRHAMPVNRTGRMDLHVETRCVSEMRDVGG